jgi:purine-binding chemotaxis protein CheW
MLPSDTAPPKTGPASGPATGTPQFVGFELAGQKYAFRIERIQEIVIPAAITRIPEVPRYVDGVSNLRGTIIPIINLRALFGLEPREPDADTRTVVVNVGPRTMGCTVDSVTRVMRVAADQIQPAPDTVLASGRRYIDGFARLGDELFILLDVDQLLEPANLEEVHRVSLQAGKDSRSPPGEI